MKDERHDEEVTTAGGCYYPLGLWSPASLKTLLKIIALKTTTCSTASFAQALQNLMQQLSVRLWVFYSRMIHSSFFYTAIVICLGPSCSTIDSGLL